MKEPWSFRKKRTFFYVIFWELYKFVSQIRMKGSEKRLHYLGNSVFRVLSEY